MENMNLPKFYVGQKIVAVVNHPQAEFKKGDIFTVKGYDKMPCCGVNVIDIGMPRRFLTTRCGCGARGIEGASHLYLEYRFAPVQEAKPPLIKLTLSKIKETEKEQILIEN